MNHIFRSDPSFAVLATCTSGDEVLRAVQRHRPDVLVLDLRLPGKNALAVLREVAAEQGPTRVVLLAEAVDEEEMLEATRLGARGIVLKNMTSHLLLRCIRKVHRGAMWLEKVSVGRAIRRLLREDSGLAAGRLTRRELEILRLCAGGHSNREIGDKLAISEGTVKAHLHHVYEKLGVKGRLELALYARNKGLLSVFLSDGITKA